MRNLTRQFAARASEARAMERAESPPRARRTSIDGGRMGSPRNSQDLSGTARVVAAEELARRLRGWTTGARVHELAHGRRGQPRLDR